MRMTGLVAAVLGLAVAVAAAADDKKPAYTGTIKVEGKKTKFALAEMAKVSMAEAVRAAVAEVKVGDADKKVVDAELDAEDGYLVWEVEVAVREKDAVMKVIIDAGSGKVLESKEEKEEDESKGGEKKDKPKGGKKDKKDGGD